MMMNTCTRIFQYSSMHLVNHMFMYSRVVVLEYFNNQVGIEYFYPSGDLGYFNIKVEIRLIGKITSTSENGTACI